MRGLDLIVLLLDVFDRVIGSDGLEGMRPKSSSFSHLPAPLNCRPQAVNKADCFSAPNLFESCRQEGKRKNIPLKRARHFKFLSPPNLFNLSSERQNMGFVFYALRVGSAFY